MAEITTAAVTGGGNDLEILAGSKGYDTLKNTGGILCRNRNCCILFSLSGNCGAIDINLINRCLQKFPFYSLVISTGFDIGYG